MADWEVKQAVLAFGRECGLTCEAFYCRMLSFGKDFTHLNIRKKTAGCSAEGSCVVSLTKCLPANEGKLMMLLLCRWYFKL